MHKVSKFHMKIKNKIYFLDRSYACDGYYYFKMPLFDCLKKGRENRKKILKSKA